MPRAAHNSVTYVGKFIELEVKWREEQTTSANRFIFIIIIFIKFITCRSPDSLTLNKRPPVITGSPLHAGGKQARLSVSYTRRPT